MHRSKVAATFTWFEKRAVPIKWVGPSLALLIVFVAALVYQTGGIKYVYSHSMYLPVLLAGLIFGVRGGAVAGVCGGLMLGPWMPIDTVTGEQQDTFNWLYRTGFFTLVGCLSGLASDSARSYMRHLQWLARSEPRTGPNRLALPTVGRVWRQPLFALVQMCLENSSELGRPGHRSPTSQLATVLPGLPDTVVELPLTTQCLMPCATRRRAAARLSYQTQESFAFQTCPCTVMRLSWVPVPQLGDNGGQSATGRAGVCQHGCTPPVHGYRKALRRTSGARWRLARRRPSRCTISPKSAPRRSGNEGLLRGVTPARRDFTRCFLPRAEQSTLIARLTDFARPVLGSWWRGGDAA